VEVLVYCFDPVSGKPTARHLVGHLPHHFALIEDAHQVVDGLCASGHVSAALDPDNVESSEPLARRVLACSPALGQCGYVSREALRQLTDIIEDERRAAVRGDTSRRCVGGSLS
jgi:hypothetical protein